MCRRRVSLLSAGARAATAETPQVVHVGMAAPDIIGVTVRAGRAEYGRQIPYQPQPGDTVDRKSHQRRVRRGGEFLGALVGRDEAMLYTPDRVVGPKLDTARPDRPQGLSRPCEPKGPRGPLRQAAGPHAHRR